MTTTLTPPAGLFARLQLTEPVRLYLGGALAAVIALLVFYGVIDGQAAALWSALGAAVLGIPVVETVRDAVISPATHAHVLEEAGR